MGKTWLVGGAVVGVQGRFSNKLDPVMTQCGDVIASQGDQLITFDLPTHGDRQDGKAFSPMVAGPPHLDSVVAWFEERHPA